MIRGVCFRNFVGLQIVYPQGPYRIQDRDDHDADVCKDGELHIGDAEGAESEAGKFDD